MADEKRVVFTRYENLPLVQQQLRGTEAPLKSLQEMLYEQASQASAFFDAIGPIPPLTRRQRWAYRVEEVRRRCRRAWDALRGRDDD